MEDAAADSEEARREADRDAVEDAASLGYAVSPFAAPAIDDDP